MTAINAAAQNRTAAITIDDLPVVSTRTDIRTRRTITKKIIGHLQRYKIRAVAFVNENKLYNAKNEREKEQIDLLRMWLDGGFELGNHTFGHKSIHAIGPEEFQASILKGEIITKELLSERNRSMRYFRHPYLHTGRSLADKAKMDEFFREHNYTIAPITLDFEDYVFSSAYDRAFAKGDKKLMKKVGEAYVEYMDAMADYWEKQSRELFGREIAQTVLLHANSINADYLDDIARKFKARGYKFITLEEALKDNAYRRPDQFEGAAGISWLHRWAIAEGKQKIVPNEPAIQEFVIKASAFGGQ